MTGHFTSYKHRTNHELATVTQYAVAPATNSGQTRVIEQ